MVFDGTAELTFDGITVMVPVNFSMTLHEDADDSLIEQAALADTHLILAGIREQIRYDRMQDDVQDY
jgi:hypothetical protein